MRMLVSYWDAGYIELDVDDPADPTFIVDTDFDEPDPLTGFDPPEGNAHQSEFTHDGAFFLAGDEDFAPFRLISRDHRGPVRRLGLESRPVGRRADRAGHERSPATRSSSERMRGHRCAAACGRDDRGRRAWLPCDFQEKSDAIEDAGYDLGIIINNSFGAGGGRCETLINMLIDPATVDDPHAVRRAGRTGCGSSTRSTRARTRAPARPPRRRRTPMRRPSARRASRSRSARCSTAGATRTSTTPRRARSSTPSRSPRAWTRGTRIGFGDLTIHEVATDPTTNLAYMAYYNAGMRVVRYSRVDGIEEMGRFIDDDGSNFWGVEQFTDAAGNRLIAGSDRDFGLQIFKYTGPGAVLAPPPPPPPASASAASAAATTTGAATTTTTTATAAATTTAATTTTAAAATTTTTTDRDRGATARGAATATTGGPPPPPPAPRRPSRRRSSRSARAEG